MGDCLGIPSVVGFYFCFGAAVSKGARRLCVYFSLCTFLAGNTPHLRPARAPLSHFPHSGAAVRGRPFPSRSGPFKPRGGASGDRVQSADGAVRRGRTPRNASLPGRCRHAAAAAPAGRPGGAPPCGGESSRLLAQRAARVSARAAQARRGGEWPLRWLSLGRRTLPLGRRTLHGLRYFLFNNSDL